MPEVIHKFLMKDGYNSGADSHPG